MNSGNSYEDGLIDKIVPYIHGHVEAVFTWEGGDSHSGLIIEDGEAWEAEVKMRLKQGEKIKSKTKKKVKKVKKA